MSDDLVIISFRVTKERKLSLYELVKSDPKTSTLTQYIINALNYYETRGNRLFEPSNEFELEGIKLQIEKLNSDLKLTNSLVQKLFEFQSSNSSKEEKEINYYLDKISDALYRKNLEKTLETKVISKLQFLLEFKHHQEYLTRWIEIQRETGLLKIDRGNIRWNLEKVKQLYG